MHAFSPNASLVWSECASIPVKLAAAKATVIKDIVYVGGGDSKDDSHQYLVCKYDLGKDES